MYYKYKYYYNLEYKINNIEASIEIPILCLNSLYECNSDNIKQNGHDTSVRGKPQKYTCKSCRRTFYARTSAFFKNLIPMIGKTLNEFF
ncbi:MAG: hypothetical protein ACTSYZ_14370, partial [Candidatus Helarchaeota archaeon]